MSKAVKGIILNVVLMSSILVCSSALATVPQLIPVQGVLADSDGVAYDGSLDIAFHLYDAADGTVAIWSETQTLDLAAGFFTAYLGDDEGELTFELVVGAPELWLEMVVDGEVMSRVQIASVPFAYEAAVCQRLGDLAPEDVQPVLNAACTGDNYVKSIDPATGDVICATPPDTIVDESDVETYITNGAIDLHSETTLDGAVISTGAHTTSLDWSALLNVPGGLVMGAQACGDNQKVAGIDTDGLIVCDTDQVLDEIDVDALVANNGYVTNDFACQGDEVLFGIDELNQPQCIWAYTGGELDMESDGIVNVAEPVDPGDAANKQYVDDQVAAVVSSPGGASNARRFSVVFAMSAAGECPVGYEENLIGDIAGPNGWASVQISHSGMHIGGINSATHMNSYLYTQHTATSAQKLCSKQFLSSSGHAGISLLGMDSTAGGECPSSYATLPASSIRTGANNIYFATNGTGAILGQSSSGQTVSSTNFNSQNGWTWRTFPATTDTFCYRVTGVDEDPATQSGVFPVVLGLSDPSGCPSDWNMMPTSQLVSANGSTQYSATNNSMVLGQIGTGTALGHGGDNYYYAYIDPTYVGTVCWKEYVITNGPYYNIRTPGSGPCPENYISFAASQVKGTNGYGYIGATSHNLFVGGLFSWGAVDSSGGTMRDTFDSNVTNMLCLQIEGAM